MLVNKKALICIDLLIMLVLSLLTRRPYLSAFMTFFIVIIGYWIIANMRIKKMNHALEEECDPQKFLELNDHYRSVSGKDRKMEATFFDINKSAAMACMGQFEEAKEVLTSINKSFLSKHNFSLLVYHINLITCLYELGEYSCAEDLFENNIPKNLSRHRHINLAVKLLTAERYFYQNKYCESREKLIELQNEKVSERMRLDILFRLAEIDRKTGKKLDAINKYKEISNSNSSLWITTQARNHINSL